MKSSKALIIAPINMTFVRRDKVMLEQFYKEVDVKIFASGGAIKTLKAVWGSFWFAVFNLHKYDLVCAWFVGYHSLLPFKIARILGKRTVAFLGGTECHKYPEYNHGNYIKHWYAWFTRRSLEASDFIFPVHDTLIRSEETYVALQYKTQGIEAFNRPLKGRVRPLYCGFESQRTDDQIVKEKKSFLSVSSYLDGKTYYRKGVDMVILLAEAFPDYQFTLVGNGYKGPDLPNLKIINAISYEELIDIYCRHEFYIQLSIAEGFPNALAEAMLYGCIPIGSSVFGIPDMIADTGFILDKKDPDGAKRLLQKAVALPDSERQALSNKARERIKTMYNFEARYKVFKEELGL